MKSELNKYAMKAATTAERTVLLGSKSTDNSQPRHPCQIICVDDDTIGLQCRGELFEELGYSVVLCNSPFAALSRDLSTFDLGVVDFHMPGLNGRELLLRMRAAGARFPIILLTGYLSSLCREDRVLFTWCIDKGEPTQCLLDVISRLFDPNQLPDYGTDS